MLGLLLNLEKAIGGFQTEELKMKIIMKRPAIKGDFGIRVTEYKK